MVFEGRSQRSFTGVAASASGLAPVNMRVGAVFRVD